MQVGGDDGGGSNAEAAERGGCGAAAKANGCMLCVCCELEDMWAHPPLQPFASVHSSDR